MVNKVLCNIFGKISGIASEETIRSKCYVILLYGLEAYAP